MNDGGLISIFTGYEMIIITGYVELSHRIRLLVFRVKLSLVYISHGKLILKESNIVPICFFYHHRLSCILSCMESAPIYYPSPLMVPRFDWLGVKVQMAWGEYGIRT